MWVISRPDLVTIEEVRSYDIVYAASQKWADWMSAVSGRPVRLMQQATDPKRFHPDLPKLEMADDLVFVSAPRSDESPRYGRELIGLNIEGSVPVGLWGPGWGRFVPEHWVRGDFLDFDLTPRAYRSAVIALNDHWTDMREWGFISNRAFDIVATGTPVISDEIDGLELFEGAAAVATDAESMRKLYTDRSWIPSEQRMLEISEMVRERHSFQARATTLLNDVMRLRSGKALGAE